MISWGMGREEMWDIDKKIQDFWEMPNASFRSSLFDVLLISLPKPHYSLGPEKKRG